MTVPPDAEPPFLAEEAFLWWLADPARPVRIGTLRLVRALRGVSLQYDPAWLQAGIALSEDLPLRDIEQLPTRRDHAAGAVDDARPDRWGETLIARLLRPPRLTVLDHLWYAGDERFGALGVSRFADRHVPHAPAPLPSLADAPALAQIVARVQAGEPLDERARRLIAPGRTMGGVRPKALIELDGAQWVIKFGEAGDPFDSAQVEHATLTLAASAGIRVPQTRVLTLPAGHAVAIRRFDRQEGRRRHALSADVALHAARQPLSYPAIARLLRRLGPADAAAREADRRELFRRMVFNLLVDNTDDHEKNHALLMDDAGALRLSPAFDVLPTGTGLGYQALAIGERGGDATIDNALSDCMSFGLTRDQAVAQAREVARQVAGWRAHFAGCGVRPVDLDRLSLTIDGDRLRGERESLMSGG